eukprot:tig00021119_g18429.t1
MHRFVPRAVLERCAGRASRRTRETSSAAGHRSHAVVCLLDISGHVVTFRARAGFSALCERYNGAESSIEELCDLVNKAFCREIELVQKHGGEIVSFLGGARAPLSLLPPAPAIRRRLTRTVRPLAHLPPSRADGLLVYWPLGESAEEQEGGGAAEGGARGARAEGGLSGAAAAEMARRAAQAVSCAIEVQELFSALRLGEGMGLRLRIAIAAGPYREYFCGIGERGVQEAAGGGGEAAAAQRRAAWGGSGGAGALEGRSERGSLDGAGDFAGVLLDEQGQVIPGRMVYFITSGAIQEAGEALGAIAPGQVAVCDSVFAFLPRAALAAGGGPEPLLSASSDEAASAPDAAYPPALPFPYPGGIFSGGEGPLAAAGGSLRGGDVTTGLAASLAAGAGGGRGGEGRGRGWGACRKHGGSIFGSIFGSGGPLGRRGSLGAPPAKRGARTLSLPLGGGAEARRGSNASLFGLDSAASEKGAVVLDAAARAAFETYVAVMGWRPADASRGGAVAPLRPHQHQPHRRPFNIETPAPSPVPFDDEAESAEALVEGMGEEQRAALLLYVPYAVRARVEQLERHGAAIDIARYISEFRAVSVMFVSLAALDTAFGVVQHTVQTLQAVLYAHQGSLRQVVLDDKGLVLIGVFGLWPVAHEDDPVRCTACALDVAEAMRSQRLKSSIGVSTGLVYSTFVGSPTRCEYSVFGTVVNKAARLMAMADGGILADEATAAAAAQRVLMVPAGEAVLKGIPEPVKLFQPRGLRKASWWSSEDPDGSDEEEAAAASPAAAPPVWPSPMLAGLSGKPPAPGLAPPPLGGAGGGSNKKAERSPPKKRRVPMLMGGGRGWEDGAASARSGRSVGSHVSVAGGGGAHSSLVLLEGESGMGKSALLRDFRSAAKQRGAAVAASVSRSHHRRQPFNGWRHVLHALFPLGELQMGPFLDRDGVELLPELMAALALEPAPGEAPPPPPAPAFSTSPPSLGNLAIAALAAPPPPRPRSRQSLTWTEVTPERAGEGQGPSTNAASASGSRRPSGVPRQLSNPSVLSAATRKLSLSHGGGAGPGGRPGAALAERTGEARSMGLRALIVRLVLRRAALGPVVLIFDGAPRPPAPPARPPRRPDLVGELEEADAARLLLVAALRPPQALSVAGRALQRLRRKRAATTLALQAMRLADAEELAASVLRARSLPRQLASFVYEQSSGIPSVVIDVAQALQENGFLQVAPSGEVQLLKSLRPVKPTDAVRSALCSRLDRLEGPQLLVLKLAAVVGRRFTWPELLAIHPATKAAYGVVAPHSSGELAGIASFVAPPAPRPPAPGRRFERPPASAPPVAAAAAKESLGAAILEMEHALGALCDLQILRDVSREERGGGGAALPASTTPRAHAKSEWEFVHATMHETTYSLLPVAERRGLHRALALWHERRFARALLLGSGPAAGSAVVVGLGAASPANSRPGSARRGAPPEAAAAPLHARVQALAGSEAASGSGSRRFEAGAGAAGSGGAGEGRRRFAQTDLALLSHHFLNAGDSGLRRRGQCARAALEAYANVEASRLYEDLLRVSPQAPPLQRAAWLRARADALRRSGLFAEAVQCAREGLALLGHPLPSGEGALALRYALLELRLRFTEAPDAAALAAGPGPAAALDARLAGGGGGGGGGGKRRSLWDILCCRRRRPQCVDDGEGRCSVEAAREACRLYWATISAAWATHHRRLFLYAAARMLDLAQRREAARAWARLAWGVAVRLQDAEVWSGVVAFVPTAMLAVEDLEAAEGMLQSAAQLFSRTSSLRDSLRASLTLSFVHLRAPRVSADELRAGAQAIRRALEKSARYPDLIEDGERVAAQAAWARAMLALDRAPTPSTQCPARKAGPAERAAFLAAYGRALLAMNGPGARTWDDRPLAAVAVECVEAALEADAGAHFFAVAEPLATAAFLLYTLRLALLPVERARAHPAHPLLELFTEGPRSRAPSAARRAQQAAGAPGTPLSAGDGAGEPSFILPSARALAVRRRSSGLLVAPAADAGALLAALERAARRLAALDGFGLVRPLAAYARGLLHSARGRPCGGAGGLVRDGGAKGDGTSLHGGSVWAAPLAALQRRLRGGARHPRDEGLALLFAALHAPRAPRPAPPAPPAAAALYAVRERLAPVAAPGPAAARAPAAAGGGTEAGRLLGRAEGCFEACSDLYMARAARRLAALLEGGPARAPRPAPRRPPGRARAGRPRGRGALGRGRGRPPLAPAPPAPAPQQRQPAGPSPADPAAAAAAVRRPSDAPSAAPSDASELVPELELA